MLFYVRLGALAYYAIMAASCCTCSTVEWRYDLGLCRSSTRLYSQIKDCWRLL